MAPSIRSDASAIAKVASTPDMISPSESSAEKEELKGFSKRQWIFASVFGAANFAGAACYSLQAPFYPEKAESKGVTPTEYGLVFGVFELTSFISSPFFGKYLTNLGPVFTYNAGLFVTAVCSCLFGLLDTVEKTEDFLILSFAVRIIEALGEAAYVTASFTIITTEFPETVATAFAILETFSGLGLMAGFAIGGILYQIGGYKTPFMVMSGVLISVAFVTYMILPDVNNRNVEIKVVKSQIEDNTENEDHQEHTKDGIFGALAIPFVFLDMFSVASCSMSFGFLSATLEPHLRQFSLSPTAIGGVFALSGGMYVISAPLIGRLCDKGYISAAAAISVGHTMIAVSYLVTGPAPFFPNIPTILWLSICGLVVHGFGVGFILVPGFVDGMEKAILGGFHDGVSTYAVISGLWASSFSLGAFLGPSIGGKLFELLGFRTGSLAVVAIHIVLVLLHAVYHCFLCMREKIFCDCTTLPQTVSDHSLLMLTSKASSYSSIDISMKLDS